jgi:hypothetical protein
MRCFISVCALITLVVAPSRAQAQDWFEPWTHSDFSPRGTPLVHLFNLEPAFLDRDLFVDFAHTSGDDGTDESELSVELEYALTRRIGLIAEAPLVWLDPEQGDSEFGVGDVAIAPRAILIESDRFILAGNLEVTLPTGSESKGIGGGEVALAPSFSVWADLGNWFTLAGQFGTEHGTETGDSEVFYSAAFIYSFLAPPLLKGEHDHAGHGEHQHLPRGLTNLITEFTGRTVLSGEDRDRSTAEVLFGVSHVLTESIEVRGAVQLPVGGPRDIDYGFILSLIYHF